MDTDSHTLTLDWVERATNGFVFAKDMREAVSLALTSGSNLIFSGPGGHGKSEFLTAVFGAISDTKPFVKSFGQGTSPEELYGGIDIEALNRQGGDQPAVIQYNPELSFLKWPVAVFEELFDAPPRVLTSLKDTLTAKELRNGHQSFPMATRVIAAATNHSPQDIAEGGPEIAALIERFPIQLEVTWQDYGEGSYMELFATVDAAAPEPSRVTWDDVASLQARTLAVECSVSLQRVLAKIIVELQRDGITVSPRTAILALRLAKAAAVINDRDSMNAEDLRAISYLPGAYALRVRISQLIDDTVRTIQQEEVLSKLENELQYANELEHTDIDELEYLAQLLLSLRNEAKDLSVGSDLYDRWDALRANIERSERNVALQRQELELVALTTQHNHELSCVEQSLHKQQKLLVGRSTRTSDRHNAESTLEQLARQLTGMVVHSSLQPRQNRLLQTVETVLANSRHNTAYVERNYGSSYTKSPTHSHYDDWYDNYDPFD